MTSATAHKLCVLSVTQIDNEQHVETQTLDIFVRVWNYFGTDYKLSSHNQCIKDYLSQLWVKKKKNPEFQKKPKKNLNFSNIFPLVFTNLMHNNADWWLFNSCHPASLAHLVWTLRPQGNALLQFVYIFLTHRKSWVSSWLELPACLSDGSGDVGINYTESATFTIQMYSPEAKGDTR